MDDDAHTKAELLTAGGALGALAIASLLATWDAGLGQANVALVLAIFVAAIAASGGRVAGSMTGLAAAVSYNFFHTQPTHSLRIDHGRDIVTVALLAAVGLVIGELGRRNDHHRWVASRSDLGLRRVVALAERARTTDDEMGLVHEVEEAIRLELRLESVTFEPGGHPSQDRVTLRHDGVLDESNHTYLPGGFAIDPAGADLEVSYQGRSYGNLVLRPRRPVGLALEQLTCAVAIADQLAAYLHTRRVEPSGSGAGRPQE